MIAFLLTPVPTNTSAEVVKIPLVFLKSSKQHANFREVHCLCAKETGQEDRMCGDTKSFMCIWAKLITITEAEAAPFGREGQRFYSSVAKIKDFGV